MSAPAARIWIACIGALLMCGGCGFKGPLYLPERNATVITHPAPGQTQTPAAKSKSKNKTSQPPQPPPSLPPPSSP
ncbi:MAG: LPS translocon maturation chaperone LptM [Steroidobacteraceae bacterium]